MLLRRLRYCVFRGGDVLVEVAARSIGLAERSIAIRLHVPHIVMNRPRISVHLVYVFNRITGSLRMLLVQLAGFRRVPSAAFHDNLCGHRPPVRWFCSKTHAASLQIAAYVLLNT